MRMFKRAAPALLLCAVLSLQGCSPPTVLYLINHTARTIQVLNSAIRWYDGEGVHVSSWDRFWAWPFLIDPGVGERVMDTYLIDEWIIDARVAGCRVRFEVRPDSAGRHGILFAVQLEADGRLYLVPADYNDGSAAVDIAPFLEVQPEGFPVEPSSRVCPQQNGRAAQ